MGKEVEAADQPAITLFYDYERLDPEHQAPVMHAASSAVWCFRW